MPEDLPIEAIDSVTSILGTLITMVKAKEFFVGSKDMADYQETIARLRNDLNHCFILYENWQEEAESDESKASLAKMEVYLHEARTLLREASGVVH
jgi:ribosomal protein L30E